MITMDINHLLNGMILQVPSLGTCHNLLTSLGTTVPDLDSKFNSPRKLQHTPKAHLFRNPPTPTVKDFPLEPVGEGSGVCSKGVLKQP